MRTKKSLKNRSKAKKLRHKAAQWAKRKLKSLRARKSKKRAPRRKS